MGEEDVEGSRPSVCGVSWAGCIRKRNAHRGPAGNRKCRQWLLLGGDWLREEEGTPFTRRAGLGAVALTGGALSCAWKCVPAGEGGVQGHGRCGHTGPHID